MTVTDKRQTILSLWPVALGLVSAGLTAHAARAVDALRYSEFVAITLVQSLIYIAAVALVLRRGGRGCHLSVILVTAIVLRGLALTAEPNLSTDAYRYVWDGRIQTAGFSPYLMVPADSRLSQLRDREIYPNINQKEQAVTIYPPSAQWLFWGANMLDDGLGGIRAVMTAADAIIVIGLIALLGALKLPRERVLIYAWHPLPLWEFVAQGHIDAAMTAALVLSLVALARGRSGLAGSLFAIATLMKYAPLVLAPALWKRWDWRAPAAFLATCILVTLPYALNAGFGLTGYLGRHLDNEGYRSGWGFHPIWLLRDLGIADPGGTVYAVVALIIMAALAAWAFFDRPADEIRWDRMLLLGSAFLWLASPHYPWYFGMLVPLLVVTPHPAAFTMTLLSVMLYLPRPPGGITWTGIYAFVYWLPLGVLILTQARRWLPGRANPALQSLRA